MIHKTYRETDSLVGEAGLGGAAGPSQLSQRGERSAGPAEVAIIFGSLVIAIVFLRFRFSFEATRLRASTETVLTMSALSSGWWLALNFRRSGWVSNMFSLIALMTLGITGFVFSALPAMIGSDGPLFGTVAPHAAQLVVAATFAVASISPRRRLRRSESQRLLLVSGVCCAALILVGGVLAGDHVRGASSPRPAVIAVLLIVVAAGLLLVAGYGFARSALSEGKGTMAAVLGGSAVLMAAAWLYQLSFPVASAGAISGEVCLRIGAYALILIIALKTRRQMRTAETVEAAARERRRLVGDLHDGMVQDLAFIAAYGARLSGDLGPDHPVALAARRAYAASRGVMADLSASEAPSVRDGLRWVAAELSTRHGVRVRVRAIDIELSKEDRGQLIRIAREGIVNAIKHGGARNVIVSLQSPGADLTLTIDDDGRGFASSAEANEPRGHGLQAMQERVDALGGRLVIAERPGRGTTIQVSVPPA